MLGSEMDLTDLDRIEVLRGPQGTLSGKNSIGGAIKLFSKKPNEDTDGYAEASYGSFNRINLRAGGNFTLIQDKFYVRVSGTSKSADGYMKRLDYGCVNPASSGIFQGGLASGCKLGTEGGPGSACRPRGGPLDSDRQHREQPHRQCHCRPFRGAGAEAALFQ